MRAISLFSNCGAGDVGFSAAGFRFEVMAEIDPRRLAIAKENHKHASTISGDLRNTWPIVIDHFRSAGDDTAPDLLAACPPCQGMSTARGDRGREADPDAGIRDERNLLVIPIAKVARALRPRAIVVENVQAFFTRLVRDPVSGDPITAAKLLASRLTSEYEVFPVLCDLAHFGVPQTRKRAFLTFIRRDEPVVATLRRRGLVPYPRPTHLPSNPRRTPVSLAQALRRASLPSLDARYAHTARDPSLPLHAVPVWDDHRYPMVAAIPAGSGRSAWENDECDRCGLVTADRDATKCWKCGAQLLRPIFRDKSGSIRLVRGFRSSSYRRMRPDEPASTVTTASGHIGSDFTIHPSENRLLSVLECADLQTIPRNFKWGGALEVFGHTFLRDVIGEAVPPRFTEKHGRVLAALLDGKLSSSLMRADDERCLRATTNLNAGVEGPLPKTNRPKIRAGW
jgi:DNA (cytosine-5)-methyltransferase 1